MREHELSSEASALLETREPITTTRIFLKLAKD